MPGLNMAMKRLLCLSALALLSACQTMPPVTDTWEHAYEEAAQAYFRGDYVESSSDARRAMQLAVAPVEILAGHKLL